MINKKVSSTGLRWLVTTSALGLSCAFGSAAWGQTTTTDEASSTEQAESGNKLDVIVVTARRRQEALQDVPVSGVALGAESIADARIDSTEDFIPQVTGVTIGKVLSSGTTNLTIRGLTQQQDMEAPVAIIVDGVAQISDRQFAQEMFDVQSVAVLRGPMGAVYGRNASGGAIIITSAQPTEYFEGYARAGYGTGEDMFIEGALGGPIVGDKLMFRASGRIRNRDGYWDNITLNRKADPYEDQSGRLLIKWVPGDNTEVDFRVGVSRTKAGTVLFGYQQAILGPDGKFLADDPFPFDFTVGDADDVLKYVISNNHGEGKRKMDDISLRIEQELGFATLSSVTAGVRVEETLSGDLYPYTAGLTADYGFGLIDSTQAQFLDVEAWSEEIRLTSPTAQSLRWMVGANYLRTIRYISTTLGVDLGRGVKIFERIPDFDDPDNPTYQFYGNNNRNKAFAFFGNVEYDLTDQIEVSLAARYDKDIRNQYVSIYSAPFGDPGGVHRLTFSRFQPKGTIRYRFAEDSLVYISAGTGFRSGQFNQAGVGEAAASVGIEGLEDFIGQEDTDTYELGFKTEFLDNALRINGAVYHSDIRNAQNFQYIGAVGALVLVPIQKVGVDGMELEFQAAPVPGLDLAGGISYSEATVKRYDLNPDAEGNWAPYVPRWTGNFSAQYRHDLSDSIGLFVRGEYEYHGKQHWEPENLSARSGFSIINARVGIEDTDGRWSVTGNVRNLTEKLYNPRYTFGFNHVAPQPRVFSVELRYNF